MSLYDNLLYEEVAGLPFNHFCRLVHPELPPHTYRTPHPRTIRTRKWEENFLSVMDRELPKNLMAEQGGAGNVAPRRT